MKRRTFMQTVVGAIAAVFMPKPKEDLTDALRKATANTKFKPPLKKGEQNPDGQLCLIYDCEQKPNVRLVRYVGQKKLLTGSLVYYEDDDHRKVTDGPQICFFDETELKYAGVMKTPPDEFIAKYPTYNRYRMCYKESLDA